MFNDDEKTISPDIRWALFAVFAVIAWLIWLGSQGYEKSPDAMSDTKAEKMAAADAWRDLKTLQSGACQAKQNRKGTALAERPWHPLLDLPLPAAEAAGEALNYVALKQAKFFDISLTLEDTSKTAGYWCQLSNVLLDAATPSHRKQGRDLGELLKEYVPALKES